MKIVLIKQVEYNFETVWIVDDESRLDDIDDEYIQISEIIEVDFQGIEFDINSQKVKVIDKKIAQAEAGIHLLKQTKAELLAIPDMRAEK